MRNRKGRNERWKRNEKRNGEMSSGKVQNAGNDCQLLASSQLCEAIVIDNEPQVMKLSVNKFSTNKSPISAKTYGRDKKSISSEGIQFGKDERPKYV